MSIRDAFSRAFKRLQGKTESKPDDEQCPVCGYYCNGKGGIGCIDKPNLVEPINIVISEKSVAEKAEDDIKVRIVPRYPTHDNSLSISGPKRNNVHEQSFLLNGDEKKYVAGECDPVTCWGECGGEGWCHIAQEWQKKIHHRHNSFVKYVTVKKKKKGGYKKHLKNKKKWQNIHNKKKKNKMGR